MSGGTVHLLTIQDIVERVRSDLNLDIYGKFNPSKFATLHNAVTLAKLSLLSASELNRLMSVANVNHTAYTGDNLFTVPSNSRFNILFDSVRSIDGNHGWMNVAPYYIREKDYRDDSVDEEREFGYANDNLRGFRLWVDTDAREKVFKKIFMGPIANALEYPSSVGLPEIIPMDYKERVCAGNPFPVDTSHQRCGPLAGWLVPILSILN